MNFERNTTQIMNNYSQVISTWIVILVNIIKIHIATYTVGERNKLNALLIHWSCLNQSHVLCIIKSSISHIENLHQMNTNVTGRYPSVQRGHWEAHRDCDDTEEIPLCLGEGGNPRLLLSAEQVHKWSDLPLQLYFQTNRHSPRLSHLKAVWSLSLNYLF